MLFVPFSQSEMCFGVLFWFENKSMRVDFNNLVDNLRFNILFAVFFSD